MTGTVYTCLHTNQYRSYLNKLVYSYFGKFNIARKSVVPFMVGYKYESSLSFCRIAK